MGCLSTQKNLQKYKQFYVFWTLKIEYKSDSTFGAQISHLLKTISFVIISRLSVIISRMKAGVFVTCLIVCLLLGILEQSVQAEVSWNSKVNSLLENTQCNETRWNAQFGVFSLLPKTKKSASDKKKILSLVFNLIIRFWY